MLTEDEYNTYIFIVICTFIGGLVIYILFGVLFKKKEITNELLAKVLLNSILSVGDYLPENSEIPFSLSKKQGKILVIYLQIFVLWIYCLHLGRAGFHRSERMLGKLYYEYLNISKLKPLLKIIYTELECSIDNPESLIDELFIFYNNNVGQINRNNASSITQKISDLLIENNLGGQYNNSKNCFNFFALTYIIGIFFPLYEAQSSVINGILRKYSGIT